MMEGKADSYQFCMKLVHMLCKAGVSPQGWVVGMVTQYEHT